jgi:hypothetical protein
MMKIKWTITNGGIKPVFYELHNVDRSFAHLLTNPKYGVKTSITSNFKIWTNIQTGSLQAGMFYSRKADFSGMGDGETKTVKSIYGEDTITAVSGMANHTPMDSSGVLQCMNWPQYKLFDFSSNKVVDVGSYSQRLKIERFLFVKDLKQLQETVHFDMTFLELGNMLDTTDGRAYEGKSIEVSLNIYDTQQ